MCKKGCYITTLFYTIALFLILSSVNCSSMSCDDLSINHEDTSRKYNNNSEKIWLSCNNEPIGYMDCSFIHVATEEDILKKFIQPYVAHTDDVTKYYWQGHIAECLSVFKQCKKIVVIDFFKIYSFYQRNGYGKRFLDYFLNDYCAKNHPEAVVCLEARQEFTLKEGDPLLKIRLHEQQRILQERLVTFYETFGARKFPVFARWMYISIKK